MRFSTPFRTPLSFSFAALACIVAIPWTYLLSLLIFASVSLASGWSALLVLVALLLLLRHNSRTDIYGAYFSLGVCALLLAIGYFRDQLLWAPLTGTAFEPLTIVSVLLLGFSVVVGRGVVRELGLSLVLQTFAVSMTAAAVASVLLGFSGTPVPGTSLYACIALALGVLLHVGTKIDGMYRFGAYLGTALLAFLLLTAQDTVVLLVSFAALSLWALMAQADRSVRILVGIYVGAGLLLMGLGMQTGFAPLYAGLDAEVRPSFTATVYTVSTLFAQESLAPLLYGTGSFLEVWNVYRPEAIGLSALWQADMPYAVSLLATYLVLFGAPFVLLVLYVYVRESVRTLRSGEALRGIWIVVLMIGGGVIFFAVPDAPFLYSVFFLFGALWPHDDTHDGGKASDAFVLRIGLALIVCALLAVVGVRLYALHLLEQAVAQQEVPENARELLLQSVALSPTTEALGSLVRLDIQESDRRIAQEDATEEDIRALDAFLKEAVSRAQTLIQLNPHAFQNWVDAGGLLVRHAFWDPQGIDAVLSSLENAVVRGRARPEALFLLALMHYQYGNFDDARQYLSQSFRLKYDYPEARAFLDAHPELRQ